MASSRWRRPWHCLRICRAGTLIIFLTFAVILATLVGQGLTLAPLVRSLGLGDQVEDDHEELYARWQSRGLPGTASIRSQTKSGHSRKSSPILPITSTSARIGCGRARTQTAHWTMSSAAFHRVQAELIDAEMAEAFRQRDTGRINDTTLRKIQRELDIERLRLEHL